MMNKPRFLAKISLPAAVAAAALSCATLTARAAGDNATIAAFSSASVGEPPATWHFATLPRKTPTRFTIVELEGKRVLKVEANDSYGNLIHPVRVQSAPHVWLSWRWRVDSLVADADINIRAGDDGAAKMCVSFDFDVANLPLGERTKLSIARSTTGEEVPTETLCYVWDNKLPRDTTLVNAFTKRQRFVVIQSGSERLGQWVAERRDVIADYKRLFADEAGGKVPDIVSVSISADADNTHGHGLAYFEDISVGR